MNRRVKIPSFNLLDWVNDNCKQVLVYLVPNESLDDVISTNSFIEQLVFDISILNELILQCYKENINLTLTQAKYIYIDKTYIHNKDITTNSVNQFILFVLKYNNSNTEEVPVVDQSNIDNIPKKHLFISNINILTLNNKPDQKYITFTFNLLME